MHRQSDASSNVGDEEAQMKYVVDDSNFKWNLLPGKCRFSAKEMSSQDQIHGLGFDLQSPHRISNAQVRVEDNAKMTLFWKPHFEI